MRLLAVLCLSVAALASAGGSEGTAQPAQSKAIEDVIIGAFNGEDCHYCNTTRAIKSNYRSV
jgi:hypothetical protein